MAARGIVLEGPQPAVDEEARVAIEAAVRDLNATGGASAHEAIRDVTRRAARKVYARAQPKPMVVVTLRET